MSIKIRASQTLIYSSNNDGIFAYNFLTKTGFVCKPETIEYLSGLNDWHDIEQAVQIYPKYSSDEMKENILQLIARTAIVEQGSELDLFEAEFNDSWVWGIPSAVLHLSLNDNKFQSLAEIEAIQLKKAKSTPSPELYSKNDEFETVIQLQRSVCGNELLQLMARRRTIRETSIKSISLHQLTDCLFSGLGITGHTQNCAGELPVSMTPSGGARNPYEAYVYARHVDGLEPGFYHYSAFEHSLGRLPTTNMPDPSQLLAGQDWADAMPCIIFLTAKFERTMWKYSDANAYRAIFIEAGHIGQNIMLLATHHGLTACPTAAFCHSELHKCLGLTKLTHSAVYALALAAPDADNQTVNYH